MSNTKPGRGSDQFPLRFPEGMRERLKKEATANGRSLNAEIIHRLEGTLQPVSFSLGVPDGTDGDPYHSNVKRLEIIKEIERSFQKIHSGMEKLQVIADEVMSVTLETNKTNEPNERD